MEELPSTKPSHVVHFNISKFYCSIFGYNKYYPSYMYVISKLIAYAVFMSTDYKADPAQKYGHNHSTRNAVQAN
jgi:hypothetical protein